MIGTAITLINAGILHQQMHMAGHQEPPVRSKGMINGRASKN
jgi:hypothetical protein